mmetsp:Transcript_10562/g.20336  ORF Transcript_10562/g.20336 Transcript_10562/m.20336 type:complete len:666 (-) Transcript_10562:849-2846(-)
MSLGFKFVTQTVPNIYQSEPIVRIPSLDNDFARFTASVEVEELFTDCERKLNSELAQMMELQACKETDHKELNYVKSIRRRKQQQLSILNDKLLELEQHVEVTPVQQLEALAAAIKETDRKVYSRTYTHLKKRTEDQLKKQKNLGAMIEEQIQQINWRLEQAQRLYNENEIASKTLLEKAHSFMMETQKNQAMNLLKLHMKFNVAEEMRHSVDRMKKSQILKMMPTKEQLYLQKKLKYKINQGKEMQDLLEQSKVEREEAYNRLERQFQSIKQTFGTEEPDVIVEVFEDALTHGRSLELQVGEKMKVVEKLTAEKKLHEDELATIMMDKGPLAPETVDYFIEKQGFEVLEAETKENVLKQNAEHSGKIFLNISFALSSVYLMIEERDPIHITGPEVEIPQLKDEQGAVFTESQLFKLMLLIVRRLLMMLDIVEIRKRRFKLFFHKEFSKAFGKAVLTMANKRDSMNKDFLARMAFKSHFTKTNSRSSISSPNKITEMIKGYAQIETQKTQKLLKLTRGNLKKSKTIQQLLMPAFSSDSEEEPISRAQKRIKQSLIEKPAPVKPKHIKTTIGHSITTWKSWRDAMKHELKSMDSELQTLTTATHRSQRSMDFVIPKLSQTPSAGLRTPLGRKCSLPEILSPQASGVTQHKRRVKHSLSSQKGSVGK